MWRKFLDKTFWKFIIVGVVNTLFGAAIMFGMYNLLHFDYWISTVANYFFASILSYFLNKYFTFEDKTKSVGTVVKFTVNIVVCYVIAYGVAKPLAGWMFSGFELKVQENVAMLAGMGFFVILNYIGQRWLVFTEKDAKGSSSSDGPDGEKSNGDKKVKEEA